MQDKQFSFKPIPENIVRDGRKVIAAFKHPQAEWVKFIAEVHKEPYGVFAVGYAAPTHYCELPRDPVDE